MKLEKVLDYLNSFEKNSFLKIIENILAENPKIASEFDKIISDSNRDLKNLDNINIARVFNLVGEEFSKYLQGIFTDITSQMDILIDIMSNDGSAIMRHEWFTSLYEMELTQLKKKISVFEKSLSLDDSEIDYDRKRDYLIYRACLHTAYFNDELNNQENKITQDEQTILVTLSNQLGLSHEEIKLIKYLIIPLKKLDSEQIINELKSLGVIFYSKKSRTIYVADEMILLLRKITGKEVSDKFLRRILRTLSEPQLNLACKRHSIDWKLPVEIKRQEIIKHGISLSNLLMEDIYKSGTKVNEKKIFINDLCENVLKLPTSIKGVTIEEKVRNLIKYFEDSERDERVGISIDGYEKLLIDLGAYFYKLNFQIKEEFFLQDDDVLKSTFLLDYNIKPREILELIPEKELAEFCKAKEIKTRGDLILNVLDAYKDTENLYLENYENIGYRDLAKLKESGILIKEIDLGSKFEELTKNIFQKLGINVDEPLRKKLNTAKDKIDIVLNLGNNDLILIECKTVKESGYNKFSSVSRQLKAYTNLAQLNNFKVVKSLLVAPEFSDEFIKDCGLEYELNLSIITAGTLIKILEGFKNSKHKQFPYNLFMRDVLIQEERILNAICK
jgi:hypothetical protein